MKACVAPLTFQNTLPVLSLHLVYIYIYAIVLHLHKDLVFLYCHCSKNMRVKPSGTLWDFYIS